MTSDLRLTRRAAAWGIALVLATAWAVPAQAQFSLGGQRAGTSSGTFLKIGIGARGVSLGLIGEPPIPIDAPEVEFRLCIVAVAVEETIADVNHLLRLVKENGKFFLVSVESVQIEMNDAFEEGAAWIAGSHSGHRVECRHGAVHFKTVELMKTPHGELMHGGPIRPRMASD